MKKLKYQMKPKTSKGQKKDVEKICNKGGVSPLGHRGATERKGMPWDNKRGDLSDAGFQGSDWGFYKMTRGGKQLWKPKPVKKHQQRNWETRNQNLRKGEGRGLSGKVGKRAILKKRPKRGSGKER